MDTGNASMATNARLVPRTWHATHPTGYRCFAGGDALTWKSITTDGKAMATTKPRITITLEQEHHAVLKRLADLQGASMSSIVTDLLQEVMPMLERLTQALQAAQKLDKDLRATILQGAQQAEQDLQPIVQAVESQWDMFEVLLTDAVKQSQDRAPDATEATGAGAADTDASGVAGAGPRPVITGATNPQRSQSTKPDGASPRGK